MNPMNLVAVFVENKPGQTARITRILADAQINVCWVTIANNGSFGVMKFLVDDCGKAMSCLKQHGLMVSPLPVLAVEVENRPGALQAVAELLSRHQLNLDNCSGFVVKDRAILIIEAHELAQAHSVLQEHGLRMLTEKEMVSAAK